MESNADQSRWMAGDTWPPADWKYVRFPVEAEKDVVITDDLSATAYDRKADNQKDWLDELVLSEDESYANRAKWVWDPFEAADNDAPLRIAGEINGDCHTQRHAGGSWTGKTHNSRTGPGRRMRRRYIPFRVRRVSF